MSKKNNYEIEVDVELTIAMRTVIVLEGESEAELIASAIEATEVCEDQVRHWLDKTKHYPAWLLRKEMREARISVEPIAPIEAAVEVGLEQEIEDREEFSSMTPKEKEQHIKREMRWDRYLRNREDR